MKNEIRFKKKEILRLIEQGNDRELCFIMLYEVYERGAFSNLVIKKADKASLWILYVPCCTALSHIRSLSTSW